MTYAEQVKATFPEADALALDLESRRIRDRLLFDSDWTQLPDVNVDVSAWTSYRQQLRDAPNNPAWPDVNIPTAPA